MSDEHFAYFFIRRLHLIPERVRGRAVCPMSNSMPLFYKRKAFFNVQPDFGADVFFSINLPPGN